jgi:hypothetical protein
VPYCIACKVHISTKADRCPLCHQCLPDTQDPDLTQTYPDFVPLKKKSRRLVPVVSLAAIMLILLSMAINFATWNGRLWSIIFSAPILYIWLAGLLTFKKNVNLGLTLNIHAIALSLLLVIINMYPFGSDTINRISWAVSYAMPMILIAFIITTDVIMLKKKHSLRDNLFVQLFLCMISFFPLILVLSGVAAPLYPSIVAAAFSLTTILGLTVLAKKIMLSEFARKLHL